MNRGLITKALSGFYYVKDDESGELHECRARGVFRHRGQSPLVGDRVEYDGKNTILSILPRKNSFVRPSVANMDMLIFVASGAEPVTDPFLIDRISVIAEASGCEMLLVLNKTDVNPAEALEGIYRRSGIPTVKTSALSGEGISELRELISGKVCAFTGNSGVGKSSILNLLVPDACMETAEISSHLGRGKHTTRFVQLFELDESTTVADTPGFASFEIEMVGNIAAEELPGLFTDFAPFIKDCRFADCTHINEPDCSLKQALEEGKIQSSRYCSYKKLYDIIKNNRPWD